MPSASRSSPTASRARPDPSKRERSAIVGVAPPCTAAASAGAAAHRGSCGHAWASCKTRTRLAVRSSRMAPRLSQFRIASSIMAESKPTRLWSPTSAP